MKRVLGCFGSISGATYPLGALRLLWQSPRLWTYFLAPIALNVLVGGSLYIGLWPHGRRLLQEIALQGTAVVAGLPPWLGFLGQVVGVVGWLLQLVLAASLLVLVGLVLVQFGTLLGAPFYGRLSERVEEIRTGALAIVEVGPLRDVGRALQFELKKLAIAIPLGSAFLGMHFLPGPGTAMAGLGGVLLSALLVGLDFFDGALERRRLRFRQKLAILLKALPASGSFSLFCLLLVSVPLLNFLTIPLCVVAGTMFVCDRVLPSLEKTAIR